MSVTTPFGWLRRRSAVLGELAEFGAWALGRMFAPSRVAATLALVAAAAAAPFLMARQPLAGGWLTMGVAATALLYAGLLALSYLRTRHIREVERQRLEVDDFRLRQSALRSDQTLVRQELAVLRLAQDALRSQQASLIDETHRIQDAAGASVTELEARLAEVIDRKVDAVADRAAATLRQAMVLGADRVDVVRSEVARRLDEAAQDGSRDLEAIAETAAQVESRVEARLSETLVDVETAVVAAVAQAESMASSQIEEAVGVLRAEMASALTSVDDRFEGLKPKTQSIEESVQALGSRIETLSDEVKQRAHVFTSVISDLREEVRGRRAAEIAELMTAAERAVENQRLANAAALAQLRSDLEHWVRSEVSESRLNAEAELRGLEQRFDAEHALLRDELTVMRSSLDAKVTERSEATDAAIHRLRELMNKRIRAGGEVLRGEIDALRSLLESRIETLLVSPAQDRLEALAGEFERVRETLASLGERSDDVDRCLESHTEELSGLRSRQDVDAAERASFEAAAQEAIASVQIALSEESAARAAAVETAARVAHDLAPGLEARIEELRRVMDNRMGPEFEARLDEWRARLDNEIGSALQAGRLEDEVLNHEREQRLRQELADLHRTMLDRHAALEIDRRAVAEELETVRGSINRKADATAMRQVEDAALRLENELAGLASREDLDSIRQAANDAHRLAEEARAALDRSASREELAEVVAATEEARAFLASSATREEVSQALATAQEARRLAQQPMSDPDAQLAIVVAEEARRLSEETRQALAGSGIAEQAAKAVAIAEEARGLAAGTSGEDVARLEASVRKIEATAVAGQDALRRLSDANASIARPFDRLLAPHVIERLEQHWLKALGINMNRTALAYLAHKICLLEDRGMGRIAAPIETIIMRQLALRSLPNRGKLEVMEIGTLFGLNAAVLYNFRGARASGMHLTLIDPLEGYYEAGAADPITGVEVSETTLRKNLADLEVPTSDYRLIKALSADPQAVGPASDRLYDLILIDGDHSTAGVAADFENYGSLVKPGGLIIFDDYGSEHWPGIQPYVDQTVRSDPNWIWIGAEFRTAILARKADGATANGSSVAGATIGSRRAAKR